MLCRWEIASVNERLDSFGKAPLNLRALEQYIYVLRSRMGKIRSLIAKDWAPSANHHILDSSFIERRGDI